MATRVIPPRILRNLRYNTATKPLNSAHPSPTLTLTPPSFLDQKPPSSPVPPSFVADPSSLNFYDVEKLFSFVPTSKLLRSSAVLHATALEPMVDLGMWVMRSKLVEMEGLRDLVMATVKNTFYNHFCAGEDAVTTGQSIRSLNDAGLRGMLVYGVEDAHDNEGCDRNLKGFLHTVDVSRSLPPSSTRSELATWFYVDHMIDGIFQARFDAGSVLHERS